jgi:hypothetical protein
MRAAYDEREQWCGLSTARCAMGNIIVGVLGLIIGAVGYVWLKSLELIARGLGWIRDRTAMPNRLSRQL